MSENKFKGKLVDAYVMSKVHTSLSITKNIKIITTDFDTVTKSRNKSSTTSKFIVPLC